MTIHIQHNPSFEMLRYLLLAIIFNQSSALYPSSSSVIDLTPSNFNRFVINTDEVWVVEFYAPWCGHCQQLVPEYQKAANALKGVIKVGAVNADQHKGLAGTYGVKGFPTIKMFGVNKSKPEEYHGVRSAQSIVDTAFSVARSKVNAALRGNFSSRLKSTGSDRTSADVIDLTDGNFDKMVIQSDDVWLVEFYAPWCGHCQKLAPIWAEAAKKLKGKVKLGALDATVHTTKKAKYEIKHFPTIKFFPPGKKDFRLVSEYDGGNQVTDIVNWALAKLEQYVDPPKLTQITDNTIFKTGCGDKLLCVIAILPHILDCQSLCRNEYIEIIAEMGKKYKTKQWSWLWAEAGAQMELESALDIGGFGYPAMAVINANKMKYTLFKGSFSKDGINEFFRDITYGRGNTAMFKEDELPKIEKTDAWDGQDGQLPLEEDIDLSDVNLEKKDEL